MKRITWHVASIGTITFLGIALGWLMSYLFDSGGREDRLGLAFALCTVGLSTLLLRWRSRWSPWEFGAGGFFAAVVAAGILFVMRGRSDGWNFDLFYWDAFAGAVLLIAAPMFLGYMGAYLLPGRRNQKRPNNSPEATPGQRPPAAPKPSSGAPQL